MGGASEVNRALQCVVVRERRRRKSCRGVDDTWWTYHECEWFIQQSKSATYCCW